MKYVTLILTAFLAVGSQALEDELASSALLAPSPLSFAMTQNKRPPPPSNIFGSTRRPVPPTLDTFPRPPPPSMSNQRPPPPKLQPERPVPPTLESPQKPQSSNQNQQPPPPTPASSSTENKPLTTPKMEPEYAETTASTQKRPETLDPIPPTLESIPNPPSPVKQASIPNQRPSAASTPHQRPPPAPTATSGQRPSPQKLEPDYAKPTSNPEKLPPLIDTDADKTWTTKDIDNGNSATKQIVDIDNGIGIGTPKYPKHPPPKFNY